MSGDPQTIIGREAELSGFDGFLRDIAGGPTAVLLEGEIGIGKTALWKEGLAAAAAHSYQVLACRPIEAETQLAYAALGDLLAEVPDEILGELPEPQRRALEVALLRREPVEQQPLQRAVAVGTLSVLRALCRQSPILVGIDDVQWLDHPSERALAFVTRRLTDEPIGLLVTRRVEGPAGAPLDFEQALPEDRTRRLRLEPLAPTEVDRLLAARLDVQLPARSLAYLRQMSGGNPFFALEIGRAMLQRPGGLESEPDLTLPATLQDLVRDRLASLTRSATEATQIAAALSRPTTRHLEALMGKDTCATAVESAARAGILELDGERVRFAHPLLASVAYAQIAPEQRQELHARLAEIVDDVEERGRHLALAAEGPDTRAASALDEAARFAAARGAPDAAAELLEQANRLTPVAQAPDARRRRVEAAERYFEAGEPDRARALLEQVVAESPPGNARARALARLGWVRAHTEGYSVGAEVFRAALADADDAALCIEIELGLAWCLHTTVGLAVAEAHASTALGLAEALGDPALLAAALSSVAFYESLSGRAIPLGTIERAIGLGDPPEWSQILGRPDWIHALLLQWDGQLEAAHERFDALCRAAVDRGDEHSLPFILFHLARLELMLGDWGAASTHAREARETTLQSGQASELSYSLVIEALVDAHLGFVEAARTKIEEGIALADTFGTQPAACELLAVRGFLELSLGNTADADRALGELTDAVARTGLCEPALFRFHGDAIEAKVMLGRLDDADAVLGQLDATHESAWRQAISCRGRALLSAARGDLGRAQEELERAFDAHDRLRQPFERARTLLVLGSTLRRGRKKRSARDALEDALAIFDGLGATLWAAKTQDELARVGGRAPAAGLTPTEERVAQLIASGRTYQETADELFISPKTVQWNLSKIYRKLGIRSRTELAARLAGEGRLAPPRR